MVARAPAPIDFRSPSDVEVRVADTPHDFSVAERLAVVGYPMAEAADLPPGSLFPPKLADMGLTVRLGLLEGTPVGVGNVHVSNGVVNLCLGATLSEARRRGVWESLVWSRVAEEPTLPSVAYTSDYSRPGFLRMGFLPITRFTLWFR